MNLIHCPAWKSTSTRSRVARSLLRCGGLALLFSSCGGCSSTGAARVESAAGAVLRDATSTAGRQLLADVTSSALRVGLDLASGNESDAALAGIQGAASAMRDYEGLPTAPGSKVIAKAAAAGSGVTSVATSLVPSVQSLIDQAKKTAVQQNVSVSTDDIIEALARGFDAVAVARPATSAN